MPENPDNSFFSVPLENMPKSGPVCQNTGGNPLAQSPPWVIEPMYFSPLGLAHPGTETLPECECEGHFFRGVCFLENEGVKTGSFDGVFKNWEMSG
jgi:hypothetical protein